LPQRLRQSDGGNEKKKIRQEKGQQKKGPRKFPPGGGVVTRREGGERPQMKRLPGQNHNSGKAILKGEKEKIRTERKEMWKNSPQVTGKGGVLFQSGGEGNAPG